MDSFLFYYTMKYMKATIESNPYSRYFKEYLAIVNELKYRGIQIDKLLRESVGTHMLSSSTMVFQDWTGGSELIHSGEFKTISKEAYGEEVERMFSSVGAYLFCQAYERLSSFLKDVVIKRGESCKDLLLYKIKNDPSEHYYVRGNLPGGDSLFSLLENMLKSVECFRNQRADLKRFWEVVSDVRHACTHSSGAMNFTRYKSSKIRLQTLNGYFGYRMNDDGKAMIFFTKPKLEWILQDLVEFAYQIFKSVSSSENLSWDWRECG